MVAVDDVSLPIAAGGSVLATGTLEIAQSGAVTIVDTRTTQPQGGLPGTAVLVTGKYRLRPLGDRYALDPDASNGPAMLVDTLIAVGTDQVLVRRAPRVSGSAVAEWQYRR